MDTLICYCFNHTRKDIIDDVKTNGKSLIMEQIISAKKDGGCQCKTKHPKGR